MKTVIHKLILGIAASFAVMPVLASDDFGIWSDVSVEKMFTKKFSVDFGVGMRAENKLKSITRWDYEVGMNYDPWKFLSFSLGYDYLHDRNIAERENKSIETDKATGQSYQEYNMTHGYWRGKHRVSVSATGSVDVGRFTISLREKYQYTHSLAVDSIKRDKWRLRNDPNGSGKKFLMPGSEQDYDSKGHKRTQYLRSRMEAEYNIRHCPVSPFASVEISNSLTHRFALDKTRYSAGIDWKINKVNKLGVSYIYQNGTDDDSGNDNIHVLTLSYKFKL